jgi:hypothetical protein
MSYNDNGELVNLDELKIHHRNLLVSWWKLWKEQVFPTLFPFHTRKATERCRNLKIGDICLLKYKTKIESLYRLCIVLATTTSEDDTVRTVKVGLRNRRERIVEKKATSLPLVEFEVGVQRLVLIHAVEEQEQLRGQDQVKVEQVDDQVVAIPLQNDPRKIEDLVDTNHQVRCQAGTGTDPFLPQGAKYVVEPVDSDAIRSSRRLRSKCGVGAPRFDGRYYTS